MSLIAQIKRIVHSPIADFCFDVLLRYFGARTQERPIETKHQNKPVTQANLFRCFLLIDLPWVCASKQKLKQKPLFR